MATENPKDNVSIEGGDRAARPPPIVEIQAEQQTSCTPTGKGKVKGGSGTNEASTSTPGEGKARTRQRNRRNSESRSNKKKSTPQQFSGTSTGTPTGEREQGRVVTLLDGKYGFIVCASRPDEVFVHFSELQPSEKAWCVGCECEFELRPSTHRRRNERNGENKVAAFEVKLLEKGTVKWYLEVEGETRRKGQILRPVRRRGNVEEGGTVQMDSFVTATPPDEEDGEGQTPLNPQRKGGNVVRYSSDAVEGGRIPGKNDEVEFVLMTDRRTGDLVARNMKTLTREERKRSKSMGGCERGVIASLHETYGLIAPHPRGEQIPFILPTESDSPAWVIGQEVEYVSSPGPLSDISELVSKNHAIGLHALPPGTLPKTIATNLTGRVVSLPTSGHVGYIELDKELEVDDGKTITKVSFSSDHSPGGFISRSTPMTLWTHLGDRLRFDVTVATGKYAAAPPESSKRTKLVSLAPLRQIGAVVSFRTDSGYGFVRPVGKGSGGGDAYFRVGDVLPAQMQKELLTERNMEFAEDKKNKKRLQVKIAEGMAVEFDMINPGSSGGGSGSGGGVGGKGQQQQGYRASRLLVLPTSLSLHIILAENASGTVNRAHGPEFSFTLHERIHALDEEKLFPAYGAFLDEITPGRSITLKEGQDVSEIQILVSMAKKRNLGYEICIVGCNDGGGVRGSRGKLCVSRPTSDVEHGPNTKVLLDRYGGGQVVQKPVSTLTFHRNDLLDTASLPRKGDNISATIVQSHQNGLVQAVAVSVLSATASDCGEGVVADLVPGRQFGFINMLDENKFPREDQQLFFHFSTLALIETEEGTALVPNVKRGDEVRFQIGMQKGKKVAKDVVVLPPGTLEVNNDNGIVKGIVERGPCEGFLLLEPSHTSLDHTPAHTATQVKLDDVKPASRWDNVIFNKKGGAGATESGSSLAEDGKILLLVDPLGHFAKKRTKKGNKNPETPDIESESGELKPVEDLSASAEDSLADALPKHIKFKHDRIISEDIPRRGDYVSFSKVKSGNGARDIVVLKRRAATVIQGSLANLNLESNIATILTMTQMIYSFKLSEVVSCDPSLLKVGERIECILHEHHIYGVCRTSDLYLQSSSSQGRERPRLNLTVKKQIKDAGGTIMAQSCMARGPDRGSQGFGAAWTGRPSIFFGYVGENWGNEEGQVDMTLDTGVP